MGIMTVALNTCLPVKSIILSAPQMERQQPYMRQQTIEMALGLNTGLEGGEDVVMESENTVEVHRGNSKWSRVVLVPDEVRELVAVFRIQDDIDIDRMSTLPTDFGMIPLGSILFLPADFESST